MSKSSANSDTHPYMRGHIFWSNNKFWTGGHVTPKGVEYFEESLQAMKEDKKLTNVDKSLTNGNSFTSTTPR